MTRKRFNGLFRYWMYLMNEELKQNGRKPVKMQRHTSRIERKVNNSYQFIWLTIRLSTPEYIRNKLPEK